MSTIIISSLIVALIASAIGYAIRGESDSQRIGGLLDEINRQLATILSLENKIKTLIYITKERDKLISALKGSSANLRIEIELLKKEQVDLNQQS